MSFEIELDLNEDELSLSPQAEAAAARLSWQFRNKPKIKSLMGSLLCWAPELAALFAEIVSARNIDTATGNSLDMLGRVMVQKRNGMTDDLYRRVLRAQLATLRSKGRAEDIVRVAKTLINDDDSRIRITRSGPASVIVEILGVAIPVEVKPVAEIMIRRAVSAGVGVLVHQSLLPDSETFMTALASFTTSPLTTGATSIPVVSAESFPGNGQIIINQGLADQEILTYATRTNSSFYTAAITNSHPSGSLVSLYTGPGLGFGTITNASLGGGLSTIG